MKTKFKFFSKKNYVVIFLCCLFTFSASAQSGLNNLSFENWTTSGLGWWPNGFVGEGLRHMNGGAQDGNSYTRIYDTIIDVGILKLGIMKNNGTEVLGENFPFIPNGISGFYKSSGLATGDTIGIWAFTKYNGVVTAQANLKLYVNQSTWTAFNMNFVYIGSQCDSIYFFATNGYRGAGTHTNSSGCVLDLDNLKLNYAIGYELLNNDKATLVYMAQSKSELTVLTKNTFAHFVIITDINGKKITESYILPGETKINMANQTEGIYIYQILDEKKRPIQNGKFSYHL